jgi:hypothetical protein
MTAPSSEHALEVVNLKKAFGGLIVTQDVSLNVPPADHRPEWRRQDHAVQSDQRRSSTEFRRDPAVWR